MNATDTKVAVRNNGTVEIAGTVCGTITRNEVGTWVGTPADGSQPIGHIVRRYAIDRLVNDSLDKIAKADPNSGHVEHDGDFWGAFDKAGNRVGGLFDTRDGALAHIGD